MNDISLYTIGCTKKKAKYFFETLRQSEVRRVLDVRLNNVSQLAAFAKRDDLSYFLKLHGMEYIHLADLAPTKKMLDDYKKYKGDWAVYEDQFLDLMEQRHYAIELLRVYNSGKRQGELCPG